MPGTYQFQHTTAPQDHFTRRRAMLAEHPELKDLSGPYWPTVIAIPLLVGAQLAMAYAVRDLPVWAMLLVAYTGGAIVAHGLFVMIHEVTHDLIMKRPSANKVLGILANLPAVLPSAISFRKFHLLHHLRMGEVEYDADLPSKWEARFVTGNPLAKAIWLLLFPIAQALRPTRMSRVKLWDPWTVINVVVVLAADVAIAVWLGPQALVFLVLATIFGLGLHPLGARWIQEHFITKPGQETYSCYSKPGNLVAFNVGHHVEHHDFMNVAWIRLPRLRQIAPTYYDSLASYDSWTALLLRFLFDRRLSASSRITRDVAPPAKTKSEAAAAPGASI